MAAEPVPVCPDPSWFVHDRFGLFIHWGLYALPARHEWVRNYERISNEDYQKYFDHFDPDLYDPNVWAAAAARAGMKYFVVTTKHHDGFCLWDSQQTDYKATRTPYGRDLLAPMVQAFREQGLRTGLYHSLIDWHHPEFVIDHIHPQRDDKAFREAQAGRDQSKYAAYLHAQVRELLTNYGDVDIMWFDFSYPGPDGKGGDDWQAEGLLRMVRQLAPNIIVNNRTTIDQDLWTPEQFQPREWVTEGGQKVMWEACQTLNGSWGYHRDNTNWKSVDLLIRMLVDSVSKGGNLLLNIGPNARGEMQPEALAILSGIGEWMRLHNRSIYGCGQSDYTAPEDCRFTQNGNRLYLHSFAWPFNAIHIEGELADRIEYCQFLHDGSEIHHVVGDPHAKRHNGPDKVVTLKLPIARPRVSVPVIEIFLKD
ncbi:MAG: alpha-L-fucosidase [Armatimonadetes bacterium]|nr:alpha-L-fucosidase [Armatimonadota bacterium]